MSAAQSLFLMLLVVGSIATNGFGALPPSELSKNFRETLAEALPAELIESINSYLAQIPSSPSIPLKIESEVVKLPADNDPRTIAEQIAEEMAAAIVSEQETATAEDTSGEENSPPLTQKTPTPEATSSPTQIVTPAESPTPTPTSTPPTWVYVPPTATSVSIVCSTFKVYNAQTTGVVSIDLSTRHQDQDGTPWSLIAASGATNGSLSMVSSTLYYNPNDGFAGSECITYTMQSPSTGSQYSYKVHININNAAPVANLDSYSGSTTPAIYQNSSNNSLPLLSNDTDPGNDSLKIIEVDTTNLQGTLTIATDRQSVIYTPPSGGAPTGNPPTGHGFTGDTSFTYTIEDSHGATATNTVNINVVVPPWCGKTTGDENNGCLISNVKLDGTQQTALTVSAGNTFTLEFDYQVWASSGTAVIQILPGLEGTSAGRCAYDAIPGTYPGASGTSVPPPISMTAPTSSGIYNIYINSTPHFSCAQALSAGWYRGSGESIATITSNAHPVAAADTATVFEDSSNNVISPLTNDSDPENDTFTITNKTNGTNGTTEVPPGNTTITYTPAPNFVGTDSFTYTITDTYGGTSTATITVTVEEKPLILYNAGSNSGNLGGRSGADTLCVSNIPTGYSNARAFISVTAADSISAIPSNYGSPITIPIESAGGTLIANNWADLLDGSIQNTLSAAGVVSSNWWSGSTWNGNVDIHTCSGWVDQTTLVDGTAGTSTRSDNGWTTTGYPTCDTSQELLCIAWP